METNNTRVAAAGSGFFDLLALAFIILKIVGVEPIVSWSWWWVLSPIWIPIAIIFLLAFCWAVITAYTK